MAITITEHLKKRLDTTKLGKVPFSANDAHKSVMATIDGRKLLANRQDGLLNVKLSLVTLLKSKKIKKNEDGLFEAVAA